MDRSIARLSNELSLPSHLIALLLLVEDKRFMIHPGVDVIAIARAFLKNLKRRTIAQGASTITQQVFNIRYAATHTYGGRLSKKAAQATWAMYHTLTHSKTSVISEYLSGVYWGRSYHGIEQAARGYFGVQPSQLTVAQGFFLCERLAAPNTVSPARVSALISRGSISRYFLAQPGSLQELCDIYEHFFGCRDVLSVLLKQHVATGIRVDPEDTRGRRLPMKEVSCYSGLTSSGNGHRQRQLRQA